MHNNNHSFRIATLGNHIKKRFSPLVVTCFFVINQANKWFHHDVNNLCTQNGYDNICVHTYLPTATHQ